MTGNYYLLTNKQSSKVASAFAPEDAKPGYQMIAELDGVDKLPFDLKLTKLTVEKNGLGKSDDLSGLAHVWLDCQPSSFAWPFLSERFKNLISDNLTGHERINWIKATINGSGESRTYYLWRFEKMLDVLDVEQTSYVKGTDRIVVPHFSIEKIRNFTVFNKPAYSDFWKIPSVVYINEPLKKTIVKEKISGVAFEKVKAS